MSATPVAEFATSSSFATRQRRSGRVLREPSVVDELMEIVSQRPCFASRNPIKPLSCLKTTVVGGCQGVGLRKNGERGYPSICPPPTKIVKGFKLWTFGLIVSTA